jgi:Rrf2 family iron-sulfur cluster assembly transcriptional regulator
MFYFAKNIKEKNMLTSACQYAIKACIYLSTKDVGHPLIGLKEIASEIDSPIPYTAKILNNLAKDKILTSGRGPHGGFALNKEPELIRLMHIVDAIEGKNRFENCLLGDKICSELNQCPLHNKFHDVRANLVRTFYNVTLADIDASILHKITAETIEDLTANIG